MVMYEIKEVPGKGKGLIATQSIPRGTRILSETPVITLPTHTTMRSEQLATRISEQVDALSKNQQQEFLALHNIHAFNDDTQKYLGIFRTNSLPADDGEAGIFLQACRINHACENNAQKSWNKNIKRHTVHALRDIEKGEEITIYYMRTHQNREARIQRLQEQFDFICSCGLCSLPPDQSQESDERLDQILRLDYLIGQDDLMGILSNPLQKLHYVDRQVRLYNEQGPNDSGLPRAYFDAAQITVAQGDLARAQIFVDRAVDGWSCLDGDDSDHVIEHRALVRNVSEHQLYGLSMKWKTAVDDVPQGLGPAELEDWLWRREKPRQPGQLANFRDRTIFPAFLGLPHDRDILYYFEDELTSYPRGNWCFLAEIQQVASLLRLQFEVKDVDGRSLPLFFYTDSRGMELEPARVKEGFTVAILQAEQHSFMFESRPGIRHEQPLRMKIFPLSLNNLMALSDRVQQFSASANGTGVCHGCGTRAASLKRCAKCLMFSYCGQACQVAGWNENGHKADCKLLRDEDLRSLFTTNWDKFGGEVQFPLSVKKA